MIEPYAFDGPASLTVYFVVTDSSLRYLDFADSTFKVLVHKAVNAVTTGSAGSCAFRVPGNVLSSLTTLKKIRVRGSTGNDAVYTIRSGSAFSGGNTTINVAEAVSNATADGTVDLNATPYSAATENVNGGGLAVSRYAASIDLAAVNPTTTLGTYNVQAFQQVGSAPVPDADTPDSVAYTVNVQLGLLGRQDVRPRFQIGVTSSVGVVAQCAAWLECNGAIVPLNTVDPSATADAIVVLFGQTAIGSPLFEVHTTDFGSPTTDGRFEFAQNSPGFTPDQQYSAYVTIVANGNTFKALEPFPVFA